MEAIANKESQSMLLSKAIRTDLGTLISKLESYASHPSVDYETATHLMRIVNFVNKDVFTSDSIVHLSRVNVLVEDLDAVTKLTPFGKEARLLREGIIAAANRAVPGWFK